MKKTTFCCNECSKELGLNRHITLLFHSESQGSGIANPPDRLTGTTWKIAPKLNGMWIHFCNGKCIGQYFGKLMKKKEDEKLKDPTIF